MHILFLGDSHCREMDELLTDVRPRYKTLTIMKPRSTPAVLHHYRTSLNEIVNFDPTVCVLHVGHNDMAFHTVLNPHPHISPDVTISTLNFANEVQNKFPKLPHHHFCSLSKNERWHATDLKQQSYSLQQHSPKTSEKTPIAVWKYWLWFLSKRINLAHFQQGSRGPYPIQACRCPSQQIRETCCPHRLVEDHRQDRLDHVNSDVQTDWSRGLTLSCIHYLLQLHKFMMYK